MLRHAWIAWMGVVLLCGLAGHADEKSSTSLGVNPDLSAGAQALQFGDYEEGIRLTQLGLKATIRPNDRIGALSNLCAGYVGNREYEEALRYCNRALRLDDRNWHAYNNRSLAYLGLDQVDKARSDLERGLELNPQSSSLKIIQRMVERAEKASADAPEAVAPAAVSVPSESD
jgi:tetratricopeptide (TPR) repeat protein